MGTRRARERNTERSGNRPAVITFSVVAACMFLIFNIKVGSLRKKKAFYEERERILAQQLESENQRAAELEQYRIYVQTKEYVEKTAKEKLGLVKPDEILLKPEEQ